MFIIFPWNYIMNILYIMTSMPLVPKKLFTFAV